MSLLLRAGGAAVGVLLGFATALWEAFLSPLYAGSVPLPVAPVLAVATNLAIVWFTHAVTRHKGLSLLPGVVWFAVMLVAANKTAEGDLLIPGNDWMGLLAVLIGALAWGIAAYRLILAPNVLPVPAPVAAPAPPDKVADKAAGKATAARRAKPATRPANRRPGGRRGTA